MTPTGVNDVEAPLRAKTAQAATLKQGAGALKALGLDEGSPLQVAPQPFSFISSIDKKRHNFEKYRNDNLKGKANISK